MVERGGFEPPKASPTDLQSVPFDHSGTSPQYGANEGNRTPNLLITNQLLYHWATLAWMYCYKIKLVFLVKIYFSHSVFFKYRTKFLYKHYFNRFAVKYFFEKMLWINKLARI